MKAREKKQALAAQTSVPAQPIKRASSLSAAQALNAEFEAFCQSVFPDEWAEPEDQATLRAVWMASARQTASQLSKGVFEPLIATADAEYRLVAPQPAPPPA